MSQAGIIDGITGAPTIPTSFVADVGVAIPAANILNIVGGVGITTSGAGNTISISLVSAMVTWFVVTSADNPVSMAPQRGYIPKGAGAVTFVLPAASDIGDIMYIEGYGNLWTLTQNAGQSVILGSQITTIGVGGSLTATMVSDAVTLVCVTTDTEFKVIAPQGNLTVV